MASTRYSAETLTKTFKTIMIQRGFSEARAQTSAELFTETSIDGVYSHGVNRFPRYITMIDSGIIDVNAEATLEENMGVLERWNGNSGPGNLNAHQAMDRAITLAKENSLGCVALANTNHWMRGGSYGWQAANAGMIGICWTNTNQNLPPWGAKDRRIGNNPLIMAVPRPEGHVVLDMAMSQFSNGAIESYRLKGDQLPIDGGYDENGNLSKDPSAIEAAARLIPTGFWKGSGLAIMLDLIATLLSKGNATKDIPLDPLQETGVSQVFLAIDLQAIYPDGSYTEVVNQLVTHLHESEPVEQGAHIYYPGERTLLTRKENQAQGVPVDDSIWAQIQAL